MAAYNGPVRMNPHQLKKLPTVPSYIRQYSWHVRSFYEGFIADTYGAGMLDTATALGKAGGAATANLLP